MTAIIDAPPLTPTITEPGVYPDIPAEDYHRDPVVGGSLSSTGARKLLPPSCPAKYRWEQDHADQVAPRRHFDLGHAAHRLVLGVGPELVVIEAGDYRTAAAKEQRDEAHARDAVPLLLHEWEQVQAMAAAIREHPISALLNPDRGSAEVTLVWRDDATGVMCRARIDWLQPPNVVDYKTALSGDIETLGRASDQHGYAQQADWYLDGVRALGLGDEHTPFVFVAQEKEPPYLITPFQLDPTALRIGRERNIRARLTWRHCTETGYWPGHVHDPEEIPWVSLPPWVEKREGANQ